MDWIILDGIGLDGIGFSGTCYTFSKMLHLRREVCSQTDILLDMKRISKVYFSSYLMDGVFYEIALQMLFSHISSAIQLTFKIDITE